MKLVHHGVTLELEDDDPRVKTIEALLFAPPEPEPEPVVEEPIDWLKVEPVEPWLAFWRQLHPVARTWLTCLLREGAVLASRVKKHVKLGRYPLSGLHRHIVACAKRNGLPSLIKARGYRKRRRYYLSEEVIEPLSKYAKR